MPDLIKSGIFILWRNVLTYYVLPLYHLLMKKCPKCKRIQEDDKFYIKKTHPNGIVERRSYCIECGKKDRDAWRKANKAWDDARNNAYNKKHARIIRGHKLKTAFWPDLTPEQALEKYDEMLIAQNGTCYLCNGLDKRIHPITGTRWQLAVDHDARTGKVRGLLCNAHNRALGLFNHDIGLLERSIAYLKKHGG